LVHLPYAHTCMDEVLKVEDVTLRGNGITKTPDLTFETPFVLYGETYRPHILTSKGSRVFSLPEEIVTASPKRRVPDCKHFGTCGACHFRHLSYEESIALKADLLGEALQVVPGASKASADLLVVPAPNPLHYRNNARFYIQHGKLTQNKMLTHEKFVVEECPVVTDRTFRTAKTVLPMLPGEVTEIEIRENEAGEQMLILSAASTVQVPELPVSSCYLYDTQKKLFSHHSGAKTLRHTLHIEEIDFTFAMGPDSFFQVHSAMAELLYAAVARVVPMEGLLYDLYAGTGTMGIIMAKLFPKLTVISMERGREMVDIAKRNAVLNGVTNISFEEGDVREARFHQSPECLLVDPPRGGLASESLTHLCSLGAKTLVYVSCNPETFIRDAIAMSDAYTLDSVQLFDMTPFTSHMEVMGVFSMK